MGLKQQGYIQLPAHVKPGGFDHAAIHGATSRLYVAHTANDALDVIDCATDQYLHSIPNLTGVAGALVSDERNLVFTSNRGEDSIGIFAPNDEASLVKVSVGVHPNGIAFDFTRNLLLAANVGDPNIPNSFTVSIVDIKERTMIASIPVPGRTRWTVFDAATDTFYVNIAEPAQIVAVNADHLSRLERIIDIPMAGPHGLELDPSRRWLFCACDGKQLMVVDIHSGYIVKRADIGGVPDVIYFNSALGHLYVAIGDPGVIEVFDTDTLQRVETVTTEGGAHTLAFDCARNKVYAFLPQSHRAAVFEDIE